MHAVSDSGKGSRLSGIFSRMSYSPGVPIYDLNLRPGSEFHTVRRVPVTAPALAPEAYRFGIGSYHGPGVPIYDLNLRPGSEFYSVNRVPVTAGPLATEAYRFGLGQTSTISAEDRSDASLANEAGVPVPVLRAIRSVESGHNPAAVRFEPHLFRRDAPQFASQIPYTPASGTGGPSHVAAETNRAAFEHAMSVDPTVAVRSTSFGSFQVLGGYLLRIISSPQQALAAFDANPTLIGARMFAAWMRASPAARTYARSLNFRSFACAYNGCCGRGRPCLTSCAGCDHYASRMQDAYNTAAPAWRALEPALAAQGITTPQPWPSWAPWAIAGGVTTAVLGVGAGVAVYVMKRRKRAAA